MSFDLVFDLVSYLERQKEWSTATFGPDSRASGICEHIRRELREIEAQPSDLMEWVDVAILAFDGAWRAGYSPFQIACGLVLKQRKNLNREWPDWRDFPQDQPIEHVRGRSEHDSTS
jgi:hypothetical protein